MPAERARISRRKQTNRRRLRSRIILSFLLLGFGLTTLFEPISPRLIEAKAQTSYIALKSSAALVTWLERWLETGPDGRRQMIHD